MTTPEESRLKLAWDWFQYHADQRLKAFNFFLVIVGVLAVAYAQAVNNDLEPFGVAVGILGVLVAVGFLSLDVRNEELVLCGWYALQTEASTLSSPILEDDQARKYLPEALGRDPDAWSPGKARRLFRHRFWLRLIEASVGGAFLAGAIWALTGFCGA